MKFETENSYLHQHGQWDNAQAWNDGSMYATGMTDNNSLADDSALVSTTPSGESTNWADAFKSAIPVLASGPPGMYGRSGGPVPWGRLLVCKLTTIPASVLTQAQMLASSKFAPEPLPNTPHTMWHRLLRSL